MLNFRTLRALTSPRSVAVIGASSDPTKLSGRPIAYLKESGFQGRILPINSRRSSVQGLPSYPTVKAAPQPIDLAIVCLPAVEAPEAARSCAAAGVPLVVVFGSGFAELGSAGSRLQAELTAVSGSTETRIIGPNSLGFVSQPKAVTATFSSMLFRRRDLLSGGAAFVSQSGALATWTLSAARNFGLGFCHFVSAGNEADLTTAEIASALLEDPEVAFAILYLEEVRDASALRELSERSRELDKPVVVMKVGSSAAGHAAAQLHTGALAGSDEVFQAWIDESSLLRLHNVDDVLDAMILLSSGRRMAGNRVAVITASGGAGVLAADLADLHDLQVPSFEPQWRRKLDVILPAFGSSRNPIDVTASMLNSPALVRGCLEIALDNPDIDAVAVLLGAANDVEDDLIADLVAVCQTTQKPVTVTWIGAGPGVIERLLAQGVPAYPDVGRAVRSLALLSTYDRKRAANAPGPPSVGSRPRRSTAQPATLVLDEVAAKKLLSEAGLPVVNEILTADPQAAVTAAHDFAGPVALKLHAPGLTHKSDVNAVRLDLGTDDQIFSAATDLLSLAAKLELPEARLLVQQHEQGICELILGARRDPVFGPIVVCGVGGVLAEVFADTAIAFAPLEEREAERLLRRLRGQAIFDGSHGRQRADVAAIIDVLCGLSRVAVDLGEDLVEIDVNPLIVRPASLGAVIVDASIATTESFAANTTS